MVTLGKVTKNTALVEKGIARKSGPPAPAAAAAAAASAPDPATMAPATTA
jgi:hypothetical protein